MENKQKTIKPIHQQIIDDIGGEEAFMEAAGLLPKQETLEEVAERFTPNSSKWTIKDIFIEGSKWQQERSYSEDDMMDYSNYRLLIKKSLSPKEWFEQFKKK